MAKEPGDTVLVRRGVPRSIVMRCPDGCGDLLTVNLDPRAGPAWRLYVERDEVTLFPSVWRETGCRAHFILWDDAIYWTNERWPSRHDRALIVRVSARLTSIPQSYETIAASLDEIPWSVLTAARSLVEASIAVEGRGELAGTFWLQAVQA